MVNKIILMAFMLVQALAVLECPQGYIESTVISQKAEIKTCSGWALNRLPKVKDWINEQSADYKPDVEVKYVGGDPRVAFTTRF